MSVGVANAAAIGTDEDKSTTIIQLVVAKNAPIRIKEINIGFHGSNPAQKGALVTLVTQNGVGETAKLTPVKLNSDEGGTLKTTARVFNKRGEPTQVAEIRCWRLNPTLGNWKWEADMDSNMIGVRQDSRLGLVVQSDIQVVVTASIVFVE